MNIVLVYGKIVSKIEFKFMLSKKHISITVFYIELSNKSIVKIKAYDNMADKCYRQLEKGNNIAIEGKLMNECIILNDFEIEHSYG